MNRPGIDAGPIFIPKWSFRIGYPGLKSGPIHGRSGYEFVLRITNEMARHQCRAIIHTQFLNQFYRLR